MSLLKWGMYEREKGRAGPNTLFSTFSMFGEEIPRPALFYVHLRSDIIYYILYYYYYRERASKIKLLSPCALCNLIELRTIYDIRYRYFDGVGEVL
jgi:hypothetical protein